MDVGLLGAASAVKRQLPSSQATHDRLRDHAVQELAGAIGVGRTDDVHWKLQDLVDRHQVHVEGRLRRGVGARRLDRRVLPRREVDRPVELRSADLDEALQIVARHQLLGQSGQCHGVGLVEPPRLLPGDGPFPLRRVVHDDLRALAVEELHDRVELVGDVVRVIGVARLLVDVERERLRPQRVAPDPDHLARAGVLEQVQGGVDAEGAPRPKDRVRFHSAILIPRSSSSNTRCSPPRQRASATRRGSRGTSP